MRARSRFASPLALLSSGWFFFLFDCPRISLLRMSLRIESPEVFSRMRGSVRPLSSSLRSVRCAFLRLRPIASITFFDGRELSSWKRRRWRSTSSAVTGIWRMQLRCSSLMNQSGRSSSSLCMNLLMPASSISLRVFLSSIAVAMASVRLRISGSVIAIGISSKVVSSFPSPSFFFFFLPSFCACFCSRFALRFSLLDFSTSLRCCFVFSCAVRNPAVGSSTRFSFLPRRAVRP
mmetsp:Transcript_43303/g.133776  ORF Transcript_43303/g.133776 Transcript_43303/m.133776 type:complete len:234 (-) Transcript_43303:1428-2129(-)